MTLASLFSTFSSKFYSKLKLCYYSTMIYTKSLCQCLAFCYYTVASSTPFILVLDTIVINTINLASTTIFLLTSMSTTTEEVNIGFSEVFISTLLPTISASLTSTSRYSIFFSRSSLFLFCIYTYLLFYSTNYFPKQKSNNVLL